MFTIGDLVVADHVLGRYESFESAAHSSRIGLIVNILKKGDFPFVVWFPRSDTLQHKGVFLLKELSKLKP